MSSIETPTPAPFKLSHYIDLDFCAEASTEKKDAPMSNTETPTLAPFKLSDYIDLDFCAEASAEKKDNMDSVEETKRAECLRDLIVEEEQPVAVVPDDDFAALFRLQDGSCALLGGDDDVAEGSQGTDGEESRGGTEAVFCDFITQSPVSEEELGVADGLWGRVVGTESDLEAAIFAHGIKPVALEVPCSPPRCVPFSAPVMANLQSSIPPHFVRTPSTGAPSNLEVPCSPPRCVPLSTPVIANPKSSIPPHFVRKPSNGAFSNRRAQRGPSRWILASPRLQRHLNTVYASQLARHLAVPNPKPGLYFPARRQVGYHPPGTSFSSNRNPTRYGPPPPRMSQPRTEISSIDPSLLMMQGNVRLPPPQSTSIGMEDPLFPIADDGQSPGNDNVPSTPIKKRALDADEEDSELPSKKRPRTAVAEAPSIAATDDASDDEEEEPVTTTRKSIVQRSPSLVVAEHDDDDSDDDESYHGDNNNNNKSGQNDTPSLLSPTSQFPSSVLTSLPRDLLQKTQNTTELADIIPGAAKGKEAPLNRKSQKWLNEIRDSEGFAEAQGGKVGGGDGGEEPRRAVRSGARKNYKGLG